MRRPIQTVRLIVTDPHGRVLLLKRAPGLHSAGKWCLPGGKAELGEDLRDAALRELREETSLVSESMRFLFQQQSIPGDPNERAWQSFYFQCVPRGEIEIDHESSAYAWVLPQELKNYELAFRNDEALARFRPAFRLTEVLAADYPQ